MLHMLTKCSRSTSVLRLYLLNWCQRTAKYKRPFFGLRGGAFRRILNDRGSLELWEKLIIQVSLALESTTTIHLTTVCIDDTNLSAQYSWSGSETCVTRAKNGEYLLFKTKAAHFKTCRWTLSFSGWCWWLVSRSVWLRPKLELC